MTKDFQRSECVKFIVWILASWKFHVTSYFGASVASVTGRHFVNQQVRVSPTVYSCSARWNWYKMADEEETYEDGPEDEETGGDDQDEDAELAGEEEQDPENAENEEEVEEEEVWNCSRRLERTGYFSNIFCPTEKEEDRNIMPCSFTYRI